MNIIEDFSKFFIMSKGINKYDDKNIMKRIGFILSAPIFYYKFRKLSKKFDK